MVLLLLPPWDSTSVVLESVLSSIHWASPHTTDNLMGGLCGAWFNKITGQYVSTMRNDSTCVSTMEVGPTQMPLGSKRSVQRTTTLQPKVSYGTKYWFFGLSGWESHLRRFGLNFLKNKLKCTMEQLICFLYAFYMLFLLVSVWTFSCFTHWGYQCSVVHRIISSYPIKFSSISSSNLFLICSILLWFSLELDGTLVLMKIFIKFLITFPIALPSQLSLEAVINLHVAAMLLHFCLWTPLLRSSVIITPLLHFSPTSYPLKAMDN